MCQCQAYTVGEALNRGLASLAVRSPLLPSLSLSLSGFLPLVRLEITELQLSSDILACLKPCFPPRWHFFLSLSLSLPHPFKMYIPAKMQTHRLKLRGRRYQRLSRTNIWRCLEDGDIILYFFWLSKIVCLCWRVYSSVTDSQSVVWLLWHCWVFVGGEENQKVLCVWL